MINYVLLALATLSMCPCGNVLFDKDKHLHTKTYLDGSKAYDAGALLQTSLAHRAARQTPTPLVAMAGDVPDIATEEYVPLVQMRTRRTKDDELRNGSRMDLGKGTGMSPNKRCPDPSSDSTLAAHEPGRPGRSRQFPWPSIPSNPLTWDMGREEQQWPSVKCNDSYYGTTNCKPNTIGDTAGDQLHKFCCNSTGSHYFSTCGKDTDFDSLLELYTENMELMMSKDDGPCGKQSKFTVTLDKGKCYFVLVTGYLSAEGAYALKIGCPASEGSGTNDPHMVNMKGQEFDVRRAGSHNFLVVPQGAKEGKANLFVRAMITRRGVGKCTKRMYITGLNVSGTWLGKGLDLEFWTDPKIFDFNTPGTIGIRVGHHRNLTLHEFAKLVPFADVASYSPQRPKMMDKADTVAVRMGIGPGNLTIGWSHTEYPLANWLWVKSTGFEASELPIGGIMGYDDYTWAATPEEHCLKHRHSLGLPPESA